MASILVLWALNAGAPMMVRVAGRVLDVRLPFVLGAVGILAIWLVFPRTRQAALLGLDSRIGAGVVGAMTLLPLVFWGYQLAPESVADNVTAGVLRLCALAMGTFCTWVPAWVLDRWQVDGERVTSLRPGVSAVWGLVWLGAVGAAQGAAWQLALHAGPLSEILACAASLALSAADAVACWALSRMSLRLQNEAGQGACGCLLALFLGELAVRLALRVVGFSALGEPRVHAPLVCALCMLACCCTVLLAHARRVGYVPDDEICPKQEGVSATTAISEQGRFDVPASLASYGLTPREIEAVTLMLEGLSSQKVADRLGIKAASVRTLHQRAYRRMGVSSASELKELLSASGSMVGDLGVMPYEAEVEDPAGRVAFEEGESDSSRVGFAKGHELLLRGFCACLLCVLLACALTPAGFWCGGRMFAWADYWTLPFALSCGLLGGVLMRLALNACGVRLDGSCSEKDVGKEAPVRLAHVVGPLRVLGACALLAFCAYRVSLAVPVPTPWRALIRFVGAMGAVVLAALTTAGGIYVAGLPLLAGERRMPDEPRAPGGAPTSLWERLSFVAAAFVVGMAFEEAWRGGVWPFVSSSVALLPFMVICVCACVGVSGSLLAARTRSTLILSAMAGLIVMVFGSPLGGLLACLLSQVTICAFLDMAGMNDSIRGLCLPWRHMLIACAAGMLIACYGGNWFGSHIDELALLQQQHALVMWRGVAVYLAGAFTLVVAGLLVAACVSRCRIVRAFTTLRDLPSEAQRLHAFLVSRGLSEIQAHVVELVVEGCPRAEVARHLFISVGTVNNAKAASYAMLGVHSRAELISLLAAELRL